MRREHAYSRRGPRLARHRLRPRLLRVRKFCFLFLFLLLQLAGYFVYSWRLGSALYAGTGSVTDSDGNQIIFSGETRPRDARMLGGLATTVRTYTPTELEEENGNMDFIYTFVNGSELNHAYRRHVVHRCIGGVVKAEFEMYRKRENKKRSCAGETIMSGARTNSDVLDMLKKIAGSTSSARDRERSELLYSMRSVERHMRWHRGRLLIVSPGHHPLWIDGAKNFMTAACRSNTGSHPRGRHNRITTVHQDVVMPYGMRLTLDSHTIEMQLFRLRNVTPIHMFLNDDYFIHRNVEVVDLLNEHGGTYVRTEHGLIRKAIRAKNGASWIDGVWHTNLFNVVELDVKSEDHLPTALLKRWKDAEYDVTQKIPLPSADGLVHTARKYAVEELPVNATPSRPRFFATHAPFVYCTRMFEFLNTRYELEIASNTLNHRGRKSRDLFTPFVYNAFIMARPWQSSPRFLPHLAALAASRLEGGATPPPLHVVLDNKDGCAPATLLRKPASNADYAKFMDDLDKNDATIRNLKKNNPLFFNINDGFSSVNASQQLQMFLRGLFPDPVHVERTTGPGGDERYGKVYDALMGLPIVLFASYTEAFCPLVRSIQLALPHFNGPVVLVRDSATNDNQDNLAELRRQLDHRVVSAMPVTLCTFGSRVKHATVKAGGTIGNKVSEALRATMVTSKGSVKLPDDYIGGSDVRVGALAIDARTRHKVDSVVAVSRAIEVPGQSTALEDFEPVALDEEKGVVLVLSLADAERKAVHWVHGASETDLLVTFPLPFPPYEDLQAQVKWSL